MALEIVVYGKVTVKVGTGSAGALETLGECRNQADVAHQAFFSNVPGDANGGDEGPPIDIQYLGEIALVRLELTKFDKTVGDKVRARIRGGTPGTIPTPGLLMISGGYYTRICLSGVNGIQNFPIAIIRGGTQFGMGTKFSTFVAEFEVHKHPTTGLLWDASGT